MACLKCKAETQVIEGDDYYEKETVEVTQDYCYACQQLARDEAERLFEMSERASSLISNGIEHKEFKERLLKHWTAPSEQEVQVCWATAISTPHVYKRGTSYFIKRTAEPPLEIGSKLYRGLIVTKYSSVPEKSPLPTVARWTDSFNRIWTAHSSGPGLRLFLNGGIHPDWTCLVITGFTRNGKAAYVKPLVTSTEQLLFAHAKKCDGCGVPKLPHVTECATCVERKAAANHKEWRELNATRMETQLGYKPSERKKLFVCRSCIPKAPKGAGKCSICKKDYV